MIGTKQIKAMGLGLALAFMVGNAAHADSTPETLAAATRYVQSDQSQSMIDSLLSADSMLAQMTAASPNLPPEFLEALSLIVSEELDAMRQPLNELMINTAAATYTVDELNAMNEFYESPHGKSAMSKASAYMAAAAPGLQGAMATLQSRVQTRVMELAKQLQSE